MKSIFKNIEGDKTIWVVFAILGLFSFLPVYSASTNLVYVVGASNSTFGFLVKHAVLLLLGFFIIYATHKIPYKYFSGLSVLLLPVVIVLLIFTLSQGTTIRGANASRWIQIPFVGIGFQTSTLASVVVLMYTARYMAKHKEKVITFKESLLSLWLPVGVILLLILPANFSTTALLFLMVLMIAFLGGYPIKYLLSIIGSGIVVLLFFMLTAKAFPGVLPNRVDTWINRIENFTSRENQENYQENKAKIAIASGKIYGKGPGKSVQKNFLPQSSSDFIFAIIIEEFGLVGALAIILLYLILLYRIILVATKATTIFGTLLVVGVGSPILLQSFINMAVAVGLFPVTGQPLPLISTGGTSIWMTCFAIGIILSVSSAKETNNNVEDLNESDNPLAILHEAID